MEEYISDQDVVIENAWGVGAYVGECKCPSGITYFVGDNGDNCQSFACVNGQAFDNGHRGECSHRPHKGEGSYRKVVCAGKFRFHAFPNHSTFPIFILLRS